MRIKNFCGLLLAVCMLFALLAAVLPSLEAHADNVNIARGCSYTGTAPYTTDAGSYDNTNYRHKEGTELTDGKKGDASGAIDNRWYAFYRAGVWHIDVDLGSKKDSLCEFHTEFLEQQSWGIWFPYTVKYYVSDNGTSFTEAGEATKVAGSNASYADYSLRLSNPVSGRYVRMELESKYTFAFASEIEVMQGEASFEETFSLRERVYAKLKGDALRVPPKTNVSELETMLNSMDGVALFDRDGNEKTSGVLSTGDEVRKTIPSESKTDVYYVVLDGDVNGDGFVKGNDYLQVKRVTLKSHTLTGGFYHAADVTDDGKINAQDYAIIKRTVLNTYDLYESYGPTDGRGDVTSKFAKKIDIPEDVGSPETWDMTLKRTSSVQYTLTSETDFGKIEETIHQTKWGTWNLGAWVLTDSDGRHAFASESTDWEYVYRAGRDKSHEIFSGGNHANEKLRSIKFFDGTTGSEINLSVGQSVSVKQLRITEETKLYYDSGDDGVYNYSEDNMYCLAVRNYTIAGPQIRLQVDYEYVKDVYYGLSYTCMMPIEKTLGLYCAYVNEDGSLDAIYETLKIGDPSYNGAFYLSNTANRAILFGYGKKAGEIPKYRIDVQVDAGADTLNPSGKERARFWDMNTNSNKLYFCLYGNKDLVKAGSERHTSVQWTMYVD